jgi:hypothetical protein
MVMIEYAKLIFYYYRHSKTAGSLIKNGQDKSPIIFIPGLDEIPVHIWPLF